jgi:hypothetical protein
VGGGDYRKVIATEAMSAAALPFGTKPPDGVCEIFLGFWAMGHIIGNLDS